MSFFKFKSINKLTHFQKTCNNFIEILRSKFRKIKVHKTVKNITTFLVSSRQKLHIRPMRRRSNTSHKYQLLQKGFPAVFIDETCLPKSSQPTIMKDKESNVTIVTTSVSTTSGGSNIVGKVVVTNDDSLLCENVKEENMNKNRDRLSIRDIRGIDERAEDFISRVREDMKLQREQSILDFQEMLARSV